MRGVPEVVAVRGVPEVVAVRGAARKRESCCAHPILHPGLMSTLVGMFLTSNLSRTLCINKHFLL